MADETDVRALPAEPTLTDALRVPPDFGPPNIRASDAEREQTVTILQAHWAAGRLSVEELESRCSEAWQAPFVRDLWHAMREMPVAPRAPASPTHGVLALTLGVVGLTLLVVSLGFFFILSLPFSITAWVRGRQARHKAVIIGASQRLAATGEILGIVGTIFGFLAFAGCAASFS